MNIESMPLHKPKKIIKIAIFMSDKNHEKDHELLKSNKQPLKMILRTTV